MRNATLLSLVLALAAGHAVSTQPPAPKPWPLRVEMLATPAAAGSAQPQLSVSSRGALLSWVEKTGEQATLKFSERTAGGWSTAARRGIRRRLVRQLGRRALGRPSRRRDARGALAAEERPRHVRVRRAALLLAR